MQPDENKDQDPHYKEALERRDKLLGFDKGQVTHSAIKDQGSDWYELENNTWESKEQRELAKKMRQYEEEKKFEEEMATYVSIGGGNDDGLVSLKAGKAKTYEEIAEEAGEYINQLAMDNIQSNMEVEDEEEIKKNFKDIKITS